MVKFSPVMNTPSPKVNPLSFACSASFRPLSAPVTALDATPMVKASVAPAGSRLIENLVAIGWIEKLGIAATEISYRLTNDRLAAKKALIPISSTAAAQKRNGGMAAGEGAVAIGAVDPIGFYA
jgi:hypothetical protein